MDKEKYCILENDGKSLCVCKHRPCQKLQALKEENKRVNVLLQKTSNQVAHIGDLMQKACKEVEWVRNKYADNYSKLNTEYEKLLKAFEDLHIKYAGCNTANNAIQEENKLLRENETFYKSCLTDAFNCLIKANNQGKITDTLWVSGLTTLWDMFCQALGIENIEEYEKEVLNNGK